jgi:uncharacterized protein (DUF1499 family)
MLTAIAPRAIAGTGLIRGAAIIGFGLAIVALLLLAAGPVGWRAGWWGYQFAFMTLMPYAFGTGVAAIAISALALLASVGVGARRGVVIAALGLLIGGSAAYFPWRASQMSGTYPRMHDITTDFADPPSFEFAAAGRAAEYGASADYPGADTAALQRKFYPGIEPARLAATPGQAFDRVMAVVKAKRWGIVRADRDAGIIDAYDRSFWFGFTDDIAIRVTESDRGSRIDIRSGARQGRGDYGVNAARVRDFLAVVNRETP